MSRALFGTDGIRGMAGVWPLDEAGARQVGRAVAAQFTRPGELVLVGADPRESSPALVAAVTAGLLALGADVENLGVIPTPGLAYLTKQSAAVAGVMITASHNPYTDNGIKVFTGDGGKLDDGVEAKLNELIEGTIPARGAPGQAVIGRAAVVDYEDYLVTNLAGISLAPLRVALDMANGATSGLAARVFEKVGAQVTALGDQPDGRNINQNCGATDTAALQAAISNDANLVAGAAFDGDGDRVILVDEQGRALSGDHMLYILAVTGGHTGVVATIMSNQGLETGLQKHGISLHRTAVGDRYVLDGLAETGWRLGGEQSGHIILTNYATTGDGLLAALQVFQAVQASGRTLAQWRDELQLLPQELINISVTDKTLLDHPDVTAFITAQTAELHSQGRLNIRPSGTEPLARVMVEASDAAQRAPAIAQELEALLASLSARDK